MLTREELQKMIENGETVWALTNKSIELRLNRFNTVCFNAGFIRYFDIKRNSMDYYFSQLYKTKE